ncbi:hypothetical protein, partial [Psychrobacter sp. CAL346-MNA-CIBAN-0220]|uniref:hypothetical protein n=1 Tax=Psychrobacter sp. CAL346-MNA-CIBAN-0220 TaxID=3140457 RepID=UPI003326431C
SGTLSGRYRSNGYVHNPTVLTARPPSRASPLPQLDRGVSAVGSSRAGASSLATASASALSYVDTAPTLVCAGVEIR